MSAAPMTLTARREYTFGDAVEAARQLEWWLHEDNPCQLLDSRKVAWVSAVIEMLYQGRREIPHPRAYGVPRYAKRDVLEGARRRGLPF